MYHAVSYSFSKVYNFPSPEDCLYGNWDAAMTIKTLTETHLTSSVYEMRVIVGNGVWLCFYYKSSQRVRNLGL